jgi:hypothetical protein
MPGQPTPPLIKKAFANAAAPTYIQNPIPDTTVATDRASFDLGFPPLTMTEILAGGKPPWGQDMNGIMNMVTAHIVALQAGQPYLFNSTLSTAMGGYLAGIVLGMADGTGMWINTVNGNTTDPDGGSPTGWMPLYSQGYAPVSGLTGGVRTLTPAEYRRNVIVLSGVLAGNLQIVVPAGTLGLRSWLIVNNTSGSFTTTVKTASGTGVQIPQGGYSAPTEVYGDGTNVYPTVAPINLPIDQNPTGSTIAQRTNAGYLFATYFNQNSSLESFSMSAIYADAGDGYHRKISLANFAAQIALTQFAGQVANAQVPQSAVTQYAAAILASANLTGTPVAPTAPAGTATSQVATTAFVNPGQSLGTNGYQKLPSGMIMQWGTTGSIAGNGSSAISFPINFPNNCLNVQITAQSFSTNQAHDSALSFGATGFTLQNRSPGNCSFYWFAIGF